MTPTRCCTRLLIPTLLLVASASVLAQRGPTIVATPVSPDVLALACAPTVAPAAAQNGMPLRVTGGQDTHARHVYGPGDLVTISAGTAHGIEVGEEFFVRRRQLSRAALAGQEHPATVHTAGWIRIYAVDDEMSLATVSHACDSIHIGDYLDRFTLPDAPAPAADKGKADRDNYGRVLVGADGRRTFGRGDFLIVDRGSDHGLTSGAHLVIYRDRRQDQNFLYELGEAVAVNVQPGTSTVRVTLSRDGILEGDYVALRR